MKNEICLLTEICLKYSDIIANSIPNILGGLIGAVIGGLITLYGVKTTLKYDLKKSRQNELQKTEFLCKSIKSEIEIIYKTYFSAVGDKIESFKDGEGFLFDYIASEQYFTVFENNSEVLGILESEDLRNAILKFYVSIKSHNDTLKINSKLLDKANVLAEDRIKTLNGIMYSKLDEMIKILDSFIVNYSSDVKISHVNLKNDYEKVCSLLDVYLSNKENFK